MRTCTVPGCDRRLRCVGLCEMHYRRLRVHGDVGVPHRRHPGPGRVAVGPLLAVLDGRRINNTRAAEILGVARRTVVRWRSGAQQRIADPYVVERLGLHPAELWPLEELAS